LFTIKAKNAAVAKVNKKSNNTNGKTAKESSSGMTSGGSGSNNPYTMIPRKVAGK
jgi:hypothetical protein